MATMKEADAKFYAEQRRAEQSGCALFVAIVSILALLFLGARFVAFSLGEAGL
jgi:hypothetical protein